MSRARIPARRRTPLRRTAVSGAFDAEMTRSWSKLFSLPRAQEVPVMLTCTRFKRHTVLNAASMTTHVRRGFTRVRARMALQNFPSNKQNPQIKRPASKVRFRRLGSRRQSLVLSLLPAGTTRWRIDHSLSNYDRKISNLRTSLLRNHTPQYARGRELGCEI